MNVDFGASGGVVVWDIIYFSRLCTTGYLLGAKEKRLVEGGEGLRKFCVQFKDDLPSE